MKIKLHLCKNTQSHASHTHRPHKTVKIMTLLPTQYPTPLFFVLRFQPLPSSQNTAHTILVHNLQSNPAVPSPIYRYKTRFKSQRSSNLSQIQAPDPPKTPFRPPRPPKSTPGPPQNRKSGPNINRFTPVFSQKTEKKPRFPTEGGPLFRPLPHFRPPQRG